MDRWMQQARDDARSILQAALQAVQPQPLMRGLRRDGDALVLPDGARLSLGGRRVRLVALGKAAGMMAAHAQPWGPFADAVVSAPYKVDLDGFEAYVGAHPVPDDESVRAGERALALARATEPGDLLIVLLSGGASAMAEAPAVPLADLQRCYQLLLRSGAPIEDVNTIRRHLSRLKGGRLLRACRGEVLLLAISDVDALPTLASGPLSPDATTPSDALALLRRHGLAESVPPSVTRHLADAPDDALKPGDPALGRLRAFVLADNDTALRGGATTAARLGYDTRILSGYLRGDARERGRELGQLARDLALESGRPVAVLAGGETTVRVVGQGKGGRNQEVALAAVDAVSAHDAVFATMGTDGIDGPTDAAGAIVDGMTLARAQAHRLDVATHLAENDAYRFFEPLRDLVKTGPTGTNVRDLAVLLVRRRPDTSGEPSLG